MLETQLHILNISVQTVSTGLQELMVDTRANISEVQSSLEGL